MGFLNSATPGVFTIQNITGFDTFAKRIHPLHTR